MTCVGVVPFSIQNKKKLQTSQTNIYMTNFRCEKWGSSQYQENKKGWVEGWRERERERERAVTQWEREKGGKWNGEKRGDMVF